MQYKITRIWLFLLLDMSVSVVFQTETDMVKHFRVIRTYTAEMPCKQFIFFLGNLRSLNDINIYEQRANNGKGSAIYQVTTHLQHMYMCSKCYFFTNEDFILNLSIQKYLHYYLLLLYFYFKKSRVLLLCILKLYFFLNSAVCGSLNVTSVFHVCVFKKLLT